MPTPSLSVAIINNSYSKDDLLKNTLEERELYDTMRNEANAHLIDALINKIYVIEKYRQVMNTVGVNWFQAEKDIEKYLIINKNLNDENAMLKSYVGLDKKHEQEMKIQEFKKKQEQEIREHALKDSTFEEQCQFLEKKGKEREILRRALRASQ